MKYLLPILLLLIACNQEDVGQFLNPEHYGDPSLVGTLAYDKDQTTGLCFAASAHSVTNVPCTPEVELAIVTRKNKKR